MKADILGQSMPLKRLLIAALLLVTGLAAQEWQPVHIVGMPYVAQAREARISGVVRLRCVLNSDGSVADVEVLSGHKIFLIPVTENARQWRFAAKRERTAARPEALLIYEFKFTNPVCGGRYSERFAFDHPDSVRVTSEFPCWLPDNQAGIDK
jgi:TonB family protein